ncbi:MAG: DUF1702 family protein [Bacteroidota bacterium]
MNSKKGVAIQIEKIKTIFQSANNFSTGQNDPGVLIEYLEIVDQEFRPIAYEGASMAIALKDLSKGDALDSWHSFIENSETIYTPYIHAGLGWAIAQQNRDASTFLKTLVPLMRFRVLDACGYYDGVFKQRQTIKNLQRSPQGQKLPEVLQEELFEAYDQGIGRSLWYNYRGEEEKITERLKNFSPSRHSSLWRGIGIACVNVGGCDEAQLRSLLSCAGEHAIQLALGAILVSRSRIQTKNLTSDIELACRLWCNMAPEEAMMLSIKTEPSVSVNPDDVYKVWLSEMTKEFRSKHLAFG